MTRPTRVEAPSGRARLALGPTGEEKAATDPPRTSSAAAMEPHVQADRLAVGMAGRMGIGNGLAKATLEPLEVLGAKPQPEAR